MIQVHPLDKPLDLFKRLALPPPKDLDSLLVDATKPISSSKSASDLRTSKQLLSRRGGLPPFPWSHASNGHSRTNSDTAKLHAVRATCPGKWARMKNPTALFRGTSDGFTYLDSITYDQRLVPCEKVEIAASKCKIAAHEFPAVPSSELGLSSSADCLFASGAPVGEETFSFPLEMLYLRSHPHHDQFFLKITELREEADDQQQGTICFLWNRLDSYKPTYSSSFIVL